MSFQYNDKNKAKAQKAKADKKAASRKKEEQAKAAEEKLKRKRFGKKSDDADADSGDESAVTDKPSKGNAKKKKGKGDDKIDITSFAKLPHLVDIKPTEKYVFHSDYFQVDNRCATIMSFFHTEAATDNFGAFWGVNKIPSGLSPDIQIILFEQTRRMSEGWLSDHQTAAEGIAEMGENEQGRAGTNASRNRASRKAKDLEEIARELQDGASYLHVQFRLMVVAPDLEQLDDAVSKIERSYIDRFATLSAAPYMGEQRKELSTLFLKNDKKVGRGYYFTSTEYAGHYNLVTHGLEDPKGEYIGYMVGDVNNSAVLFDVNGYKHHCVIADEGYEQKMDRAHVSSLWGSKLSQSCLLNDGRVVHLILDGTDLDKLGPKFERLTSRIDMNRGDVNMFEMFGDRRDQLSIFPAQMVKLVLMAEQAYETTPNDRSIIRSSLEQIATDFYVDQRMWYANAKANQHKLRVVGIPHQEVPKLEMFVSYLDMNYKAMVNQTARDDEKLHALSVLSATFRNLLSNNGDLFNKTTNPEIDQAKNGRRVIYDFSQLMQRGSGIAMAQLVNIIGFAVGNLGMGDTVIVHGAEKIDSGVKEYVTTQFNRLFDKGGRVAYLYNNISSMMADKVFSEFDKADYTILGTMSESAVAEYQKLLGQEIPADLAKLVTNKAESNSYIRRGFDNVVFHRDLLLGLHGRREDR